MNLHNKKYIFAAAIVVLFGFGSVVHAAGPDRLVKTATDHKVFLVQNERRIHIPSPSVFEAGGYTWADIRTISEKEMESIRNTALIKSPVDAKVYLIKDGLKAWIPNEDAFLGAGLRWDDIVLITQAQVDFYPDTTFAATDAEAIARVKTTPVVQPVVAPSSVEAYGDALVRDATMARVESMSPLYGGQTNALALNNLGQVVGWTYSQEVQRGRAFLWQDGVMQDIGSLAAGTGSGATDINDHGQIVGYSYFSPTESSYKYVFSYKHGEMHSLGLTDDRVVVNNSGVVGGTRVIRDATTSGFTITDGAKAWYTNAIVGVNNHGALVEEEYIGQGNYALVYIHNGVRHQVIAHEAAVNHRFTGMNDNGDVIGWYVLPNDTSAYGFLWSDGRVTKLGEGVMPVAVNNKQQVVFQKGSDGYLWYMGHTIHLNNLIEDVDIDVYRPIDINDHGQVLAHQTIAGSPLLLTLPSFLPFGEEDIEFDTRYKPPVTKEEPAEEERELSADEIDAQQ